MERCSRSRGPNFPANWLIQKSGGAEGSRTPDLLIANETLYQLSYDPIQFFYSSNDRYYGVFRVNGKLIWKSQKTSDRELAKRKLKKEKEKHGRETDSP